MKPCRWRLDISFLMFIAITAPLVMVCSSRADDALAETLAGAIRSAPTLDATARTALAQTAAEVARGLPALPPEVTARLGGDLKAVIAAERWPFVSDGRDRSPEGIEWLQQGLRIAVDRLPRLEHPSGAELATIKAWPNRAAIVAIAYTREALRGQDPDFVDQVARGVQERIKSLAPLFGNGFVPELLTPCGTGAQGESVTIERVVREALDSDETLRLWRQQRQQFDAQQADFEAQRLANRSLEPAQLDLAMRRVDEGRTRRRAAAIAAEAQSQQGVTLRALQQVSVPCLRAAGVDPTPPSWHTDLGVALAEREQERQQAESDAAFRAIEAGFARAGEEPPPTEPPLAPARGKRLTMDEAIEVAFQGTGIVVIHWTAVPPPSWSRATRLFSQWRDELPAQPSKESD